MKTREIGLVVAVACGCALASFACLGREDDTASTRQAATSTDLAAARAACDIASDGGVPLLPATVGDVRSALARTWLQCPHDGVPEQVFTLARDGTWTTPAAAGRWGLACVVGPNGGAFSTKPDDDETTPACALSLGTTEGAEGSVLAWSSIHADAAGLFLDSEHGTRRWVAVP